MAMLLLKSAWSKFSGFRKKLSFSRSNRIVFGLSNSNSKLTLKKLTLVQNFGQIGQEIKKVEFPP